MKVINLSIEFFRKLLSSTDTFYYLIHKQRLPVLFFESLNSFRVLESNRKAPLKIHVMNGMFASHQNSYAEA